MNNFSASIRSTFHRMNNDPHYWSSGEIGLNTEVGKEFMKQKDHIKYHQQNGY